MLRKSQWGFKIGTQNAKRVSMGFENWVWTCPESLNKIIKLGLRMPRESEQGFKT